MVTNRKVTGIAASMPAGLAVGGIVSLLVTLLGAVLAANLISGEKIPEGSIGYCSMVILLLSSITGAAVAVNRIKHRKLYVSLLSGLIYYAVLLAITAIFFGGRYHGMGVTALVIAAGSGTTALLNLRQGRGPHRRKSKMVHR